MVDVIQSDDSTSLKIVTMNILAPCYNKVGSPCNRYALESEDENMYMERHRIICDKLLKSEADIICLQEFWSGSAALRNLYINELCQPETDWYKSEFDAPDIDDGSSSPPLICFQHHVKGTKYTMRELRRTSHWRTRDDSIVTFVKNSKLVIQDAKNILFHDCGDRVALLLLIGLLPQNHTDHLQPLQQFLCVNTHLLFPHNEYSTKIRMREITKILGFIEAYKQRDLCTTVCGRSDVRLPIIITGDFNGGPRGSVYKFIKSQNYRCAVEEVLAKDDVAEGVQKVGVSPALSKRWVTHMSHLGKSVAVDHVFYLNPSEQVEEKLPPLPDWTNLVFREVMQRLVEKFGGTASMRDIFAAFDRDHTEYITPDEFEEALRQLGFDGEGTPALTKEELDVLMQSADMDKNGMIDYQEFCDRFWMAASIESMRLQEKEQIVMRGGRVHSVEQPLDEGEPMAIDFAEPQPVQDRAEIFSDRLAFARSKWLTKPLQGSPSDGPSLTYLSSSSPASRIIEVVLEDELVDPPLPPSIFDDSSSGDGDDSYGSKEDAGPRDEWDSFEGEEGVFAQQLPLDEQPWTGGLNTGPSSSSSAVFVELPSPQQQAVEGSYKTASSEWGFSQPLGDLRVTHARLWPESLERGEWPADFTLSDHGLVEVVFRVTRSPSPTVASEVAVESAAEIGAISTE